MPNLQRDQAVPAKLLAFEYVKSTDFFQEKQKLFNGCKRKSYIWNPSVLFVDLFGDW